MYLPPQGLGPDGQNLDFFKNRARKGLPKLRGGSKTLEGVFARDSEFEREELYLNEKK